MKVKMLTLAAGPEGITRPGAVIDVDETVARQLIEGCYAAAMEAEDGDNKATAGGRAAKPRRSKAAPED